MTVDWTGPEPRAALALLEAQLDAERQDKRIPGVSAAVVYDQEVVWAKGLGYANLEERIPADPRTIYRVGSITKLFTATVLMQLRDAGKLHLDDPIEKHLPEFKVRSGFLDGRPPSFRQVASHMSGLPREAPLDHWQTLEFPSVGYLLESLKHAEMIFPAMTEFKYSNLGVAILGHALERIADQPYKEYVAEHILRPLGMHSSGFDLTDEMKARVAIGYVTGKNKPPEIAPHPHIAGFTPAGQLYSSVEDMSHFISLQFRDGPAGGNQVLGGSSLREMRSPVFMNADWKSGVAIGWMLGRVLDCTTIGHSGGIHGFTTNITLVPDLKLGVAVFTNTGANPQSTSLSALELLIPVISRAIARQQAALGVAAPADWQKYVGRYTGLNAAEVNVAIVDEKLLITYPGAPPGSEVSLMPVGEHRFRMKGGPSSGELAVFELDEGGNVTQMRTGAYAFRRQP